MANDLYKLLGLPTPDGIDPNQYTWERVYMPSDLMAFAKAHSVVRDVRVFTEDPIEARRGGKKGIYLGWGSTFKTLVAGVEFSNGQVVVAVGTDEAMSMSSERYYEVSYWLLTPKGTTSL